MIFSVSNYHFVPWGVAIHPHKYRSIKIRFSWIFSNHHHISSGDFLIIKKKIIIWALGICTSFPWSTNTPLAWPSRRAFCSVIYIKYLLLLCCCKGSSLSNAAALKACYFLSQTWRQITREDKKEVSSSHKKLTPSVCACIYTCLWSLIVKWVIIRREKLRGKNVPVYFPFIMVALISSFYVPYSVLGYIYDNYLNPKPCMYTSRSISSFSQAYQQIHNAIKNLYIHSRSTRSLKSCIQGVFFFFPFQKRHKIEWLKWSISSCTTK